MTDRDYELLGEEIFFISGNNNESICHVCKATVPHTGKKFKANGNRSYFPAEVEHFNSQEHKENRILWRLAGN